MGVYFLDLKYEQVLNGSFALENGSFDLDFAKCRYSTGDKVDIMLDVPLWQWLAIKDNCSDKLMDVRGGGRFDRNHYIFISFVVAYKRHVFSPSRKNPQTALEPGSASLYLKPVSWGHEDVFKWLYMGIVPSWLTEEEIVEYKGASE